MTKVNPPHLAKASSQFLGMEPSTTVPPSISHNSSITSPLKLHQIYLFVCHSYSQNKWFFFIFLNICSSVLTGLSHLSLLSQTQMESSIPEQHGMELSLNTGSSLLPLSILCCSPFFDISLVIAYAPFYPKTLPNVILSTRTSSWPFFPDYFHLLSYLSLSWIIIPFSL